VRYENISPSVSNDAENITHKFKKVCLMSYDNSKSYLVLRQRINSHMGIRSLELISEHMLSSLFKFQRTY